jgi:O-antigen/teichoic acid export membrane protein
LADDSDIPGKVHSCMRHHSTVQRPNAPRSESNNVLIPGGVATATCHSLAEFSPRRVTLNSMRSVPLTSLRPDLRKLTTSGSFAVADEFLFAASNLILNLGLARSLSPSDYGAFTVAYAALLLFGAAHTALLTEPLMVFGSSKYTTSFEGYLRLLVRGHLIATGLVGVLLTLITLLLVTSPPLSTALFYVAVSGPLILLPWLLRRACYARLLAHIAAFGGALYCASILTGLLWFAHAGLLSIRSSLLLMAGASLAASIFMMKFLGSPQGGMLPPPTAKEVVADHWQYGRWAVGSAILAWLPASIYYFILPQLAGVDAAGALKAVINLVLPLLHGYTALSMVLLPALSSAGSVTALRGRLNAALSLYVLSAAVYCGIVIFYHHEVFQWLYRGRYLAVSWLLPLAAPMVVASGVATVYATALRALQRPDYVFWSNVSASVAALTAGLLLTATYHLMGAVLGLTLGYVVTATVAGFNLRTIMAVRQSDEVI